jgi:hypothetical protein
MSRFRLLETRLLIDETGLSKLMGNRFFAFKSPLFSPAAARQESNPASIVAHGHFHSFRTGEKSHRREWAQ